MMDEKQIKKVLGAYLRGEWPREAAIVAAPRLSSWSIVVVKSRVPDEYQMRLTGTATGHPDLPDGSITTSPVIWIDRESRLAHTMSRLYALEDEASEPVT